MLDAPKFATGGRVSFAPAGTLPSDKSAWTELPVRDCSYWFDESGEYRAADLKPHQDAINQLIANMKKASESYSIKQPVRWVTAADATELTIDQLELYYGIGVKPDAWGNWAVTLPGSKSTINKRSKPMTLTKDHEYKDNDGDTLTIAQADIDEPLAIAWIDRLSSPFGFNVTAENSVPLALNVLGYDRPTPGDGSHVTVDGFFVPGIRIQGDAQRAEFAAKAISYLKSVDIYDQQAAERKANEESAAKREAEHKRRVAVKEDARVSLASAVRVAEDYGISPSRAEELIAAATDYRAAVAAVGAP